MDAHVDRGRPNCGTLWEARTNFLQLGACEDIARQHARRPTPDEPQTRHWAQLDDVPVELIPATDVAPWNLLHDGTVIGLKRTGERVSMIVAIPYLRARVDVPGAGFVLELLACLDLEYEPYEGSPLSSFEAKDPDEHDSEVAVVGDSIPLGVEDLDLEGLILAVDVDVELRPPLTRSLGELGRCWESLASFPTTSRGLLVFGGVAAR